MTICDWPISYTACGAPSDDPESNVTGCDKLDALDPAERAIFEQMAVDMLRSWTGNRFGKCEVAVRPCSSNCASARQWMSTFWGRGPYPWQGRVSAGSWVPMLIGGEWFNVGCACAGTCTCSTTGPAAIRLPGPVVEVTEVRIDGEVLPAESYSLMYTDVLVRRDGQRWPACQDLQAETTGENTFEVVYSRGVTVPDGGRVAAGILACELAKAACNDKTCQLPQRVQTVTRQGITIGMAIDTFDDLKDGHTGIWLIDSWIASTKAAPPRFAGVRSPDFTPRVAAMSRWPR